MKQLKMIITLAITVFCFTATNAQSKTKRTTIDTIAKVYQCPMKCEGDKTYNKAGECPKCGMNLKAKSIPVMAAKYQCPMKCEGNKLYSKAGKCPECNMTLAKLVIKKQPESHQHNNHN
ncbi:MAG: hypothetical protein H7101_04435 [Deinococcales bacterium]|nr:hypothetical protein [Chitinophagaceae bacterium]